jgi:16S rRNA (cytosine967-C5)-methyltransferase
MKGTGKGKGKRAAEQARGHQSQSERERGRTRAPEPATGRELARGVLTRVERDGAFASRALAAALDRARSLGGPERALATELVYGVARRRARLDRALDAVSDRGLAGLSPEARNVLRVGAYQLLFLDRVPAYAAVDDAVEAAKRLAGRGLGGLANALLRRVAERGEPPLPDRERDPLGHLVEACGFPEWLARLALAELGTATALAIGDASGEPAPLALRAHRARASRDELAAALAAERPGAVLVPSPVAPDALLARSLDAPARTAAFAAGRFAIQDVGAQLVAELCAPRPGDRVLDACAGMGGKTAHLAALAAGRARIDAVDQSAPKLERARAEWRRLGVEGVSVLAADLTRPLPPRAGPYDRVLLDAPCTGLGVLRRHPEVLLRRAEADLTLMAATQRRMLEVVAERVAAGGTLVYSVCTFDRAEGADVVERFLSAHPEFRMEPPPDGSGAVDWRALGAQDGVLRTWPHREDADAFFAAHLRRRG